MHLQTLASPTWSCQLHQCSPITAWCEAVIPHGVGNNHNALGEEIGHVCCSSNADDSQLDLVQAIVVIVCRSRGLQRDCREFLKPHQLEQLKCLSCLLHYSKKQLGSVHAMATSPGTKYSYTPG